MEGFDTVTMSYLASPMSLNPLQNTDFLGGMPGMELPDQASNFDTETFVSGDEFSFSQPPMSHPTLKRFSSTYDDPFAEGLNPFDQPPPDQNQLPESPGIDRDHKLLSFSLPIYNFTLLDYSLRRTSLSLSAQLHGMFFLAESPWAPTGDVPPPPPELTCYRRNLFQITGSLTMPRTLRYIMTDQGDRIPILAQELTISATESVEGNAVKIISVPWKTPASSTGTQPEEKVEKEPPSIPLDTMAGQDMDSDYATFPIAWKRLQFRIATANNGRRKELQQHFVVRLKVVATLSTGAKIAICEAHSGAIIVRGRSPRNFQSRKDFPLGGSAGSSRKNMQPPSMSRTSTAESTVPKVAPTSAPAPTKQETTSPEAPQMVFQFENNELQHSSPGFPDWNQLPQQPNTGNPLPTPTVSNSMLPNMPPYTQPSPEMPLNITHPAMAMAPSVPAPLSLTFSDDEGPSPPAAKSSSKAPTSHPSPSVLKRQNSALNTMNAGNIPTSAPVTKSQRPRLTSQASSSVVLPSSNFGGAVVNNAVFSNSPDESADQLYEYFPLGLDDWMPPVDAVYRPHVVHHTNLPTDPKAMAVRMRGKRYFSEDMS